MPSVLKRLRQLAVLEFLNIGFLGGTVLLVLPSRLEVGNLVGFALTALLLTEGAAYWALKEHQLRTRRRLPRGLGVFRVLRLVNGVALAAGGVVVGYATATAPGWGSLPGAAFWLLAVLEYINYFVVQLSHETWADLRRLARTRRLHPSHLAIDLRRHRETHP